MQDLLRVAAGFLVALVILAGATRSPLVGQVSDEIPRLTDVYSSSGIDFLHVSGSKSRKDYLFEVKGGGAAFLDYDSDGWLDLLLVQGSTLERLRKGERPRAALYHNLRNGRFEDVSDRAGLATSGWGMGAATGDYDNDGRVDIYLTCLTGNVLYRNLGDGTFENVTVKAGVGGGQWSASAAFGDYDSDGFLDLFVGNYVALDFDNLPEPGSGPRCNYRGEPGYCGPLGLQGAPNVLYRNRGDGTFEDVTHRAGVEGRSPYFSLGVIWSDIDEDGDLDLFVANDSTPNELYLNRGEGTFEDASLRSGLAANADGRFQAGMGVDFADYNNDGLLDLYITHFANDYSTLYQNQGGLRFLDVTMEARLAQPEWLWVSWGTRFVDLNQDGWKDLVHANGHVYPFLQTAGWAEVYGQPLSVYLNERDGTFRDISRDTGPDAQAMTVSRGVAFGDYDNDGDIDFVVANLNDRPQVFRNDRRDSNHWVMFRLKGTRSNREGIGARVEVESGGLRQVSEVRSGLSIYSACDSRVHFGLGSSTQLGKVTVRWPSGHVDHFSGLVADRHYLVTEGEGIVPEK